LGYATQGFQIFSKQNLLASSAEKIVFLTTKKLCHKQRIISMYIHTIIQSLFALPVLAPCSILQVAVGSNKPVL